MAFSENGLIIRWWSLESVWWEKLTRNLAPVQCTKLIFVPPWEGFSPNSTKSSVMASVLHDDGQISSPVIFCFMLYLFSAYMNSSTAFTGQTNNRLNQINKK